MLRQGNSAQMKDRIAIMSEGLLPALPLMTLFFLITNSCQVSINERLSHILKKEPGLSLCISGKKPWSPATSGLYTKQKPWVVRSGVHISGRGRAFLISRKTSVIGGGFWCRCGCCMKLPKPGISIVIILLCYEVYRVVKIFYTVGFTSAVPQKSEKYHSF